MAIAPQKREDRSASYLKRAKWPQLARAFPTAPQPPARIIVDPASLARSASTDPHYPETTELRSLAMDNMSEPNRRTVLAAAGAAGAFGLAIWAAPGAAAPAGSGAAEGDNAIRPFSINAPEEALLDLRRRIAATRWPDRETVTDQ